MLNEDKIKLMTSISMFEKKEGRRVFPMSRYFRGDYVSSHMVRSFVGYTFCWILGTVVWVLYKVELLFSLGMKAYLTGLRRLSKRYEYQNKTRDMTREGGRT